MHIKREKKKQNNCDCKTWRVEAAQFPTEEPSETNTFGALEMTLRCQ